MGVFDELRIVDAPNSPRMGDAAEPWLRDFARALFGSYDSASGRRLITEALLLISKKNSKSTAAAAVMLTILIRNWRQSGEFGILSPTIEIANNSFWPARDMVRADDELRDLIHIQEHTRTLTHRVTNATLKVVAADSEAVAGKKWIVTLIDELWLFGKRSNSENMLREATGGLASRPEGFVIYLSTQSDEPPAGVFKQKLQYARGVRDGRINDPQFLPVLYEFPKVMLENKEHLEPKNFRITNPNLGVSVDEQYLTRELAKAQDAGEDSLRGFLAKHLNVEIGLALASDYWVGASYWPQCAVPGMTLDELIERSEVVVMGVDGGGLDDMLGVAVLGRVADTGRWLLWNRAYLNPIALERRKALESRYKDFERDGDLRVVSGAAAQRDVNQVAAIARKLLDSGKLPEKGIGLDPEKTHKVVLTALHDAGVEDAQEPRYVLGISQGWRLVGAITVCERKLEQRELLHAGQPLMTWCVGNARVEPRGNAVLITKQLSGGGKIDPLMATFNAVALMSLNPQPQEAAAIEVW